MPVIIKNGKTYGDRSVTLSKAEYDALSSAEKLNGTVYYIYDSNENMGINVELTQAQYDALVDPDPDTVYYITDGTVSYPTADDMRYQEGVSVADALDTLNAGLLSVMKPTLLWEGDKIGSGSITIPGLSEWMIVMYCNYTTNDYLLIGSPLRGGTLYGIYDSTGSATMSFRFTGSLDSDTITIDSNNRGIYVGSNTTYSYSSTGASDVHIRRVYGLFKKPTSN